MNPNDMLGAVQRAILSTDFTSPGGYLSAKQQEAFFEYLRHERNPFLSQARMVRMPQKRWDVEKLHLGRPITRAATENSAVTYPSTTMAGRTVRLDAEKLQASWEQTRDISIQNIEGDKLQQHIMNMMMRRYSIDLEILAVQGVADSTPAADEMSLLTGANNGWSVLSDEAHVVDGAGSGPHYDLFRDGYLRMPSHLVLDPGLRWIWNPAAKVRLASSLQNRQDSVGGAAMLGNISGPFGLPFLEASTIPRNLTVSALTPASAAQVRSLVPGPYYLTASLKNLKVNIDGAGAKTIDLSTAHKHSVTKGPLLAVDLAKVINDYLVSASGYSSTAYANVAKDDGDGFLMLTSPTTGASSSIVINPSSAPSTNADTTVGLLTAAGTTGDEETTTGGAAGAGVSKSGSFIWLANPQNFLYGVVEEVRVSSFYDQDKDKDQVVIYSWADFQIEEVDAVVKIKNVVV